MICTGTSSPEAPLAPRFLRWRCSFLHSLVCVWAPAPRPGQVCSHGDRLSNNLSAFRVFFNTPSRDKNNTGFRHLQHPLPPELSSTSHEAGTHPSAERTAPTDAQPLSGQPCSHFPRLQHLSDRSRAASWGWGWRNPIKPLPAATERKNTQRRST